MKNIITPTVLLSAILFFFSTEYFDKNKTDTTYAPIAETAVNNIKMPIEVIGEEGTIVERTFTIDNQTLNNTSKIWLMVNNLSYENKGSVQINGGAWLQLNHSTATVNPKELAYGGMVYGGFNTIRLTIPSNGLQQNTNTIKFRFDKSDAISIGYRVIKMNLLDSGGTKLLTESLFEQDNPTTWSAPAGSSVSNGRNLWYNKDLWNHYTLDNDTGFWYGKTIPNRRTINAKCTDCHTQDGRDLEMFSYSNLSIIERSKFHGMTEQEGKDIAAYIRSLSSLPKVGRHGRPWNPPYQPGPVLANRPIEQWAAGAGLDWVLENDADMAPYIFTNGTSKEAVRGVFDSDKMDDRTLLPLAIQFPDWKHWLPIVHPKDAYSKNNWWNNLADSKNPIKNYEAVRAKFVNNYSLSNIKSFDVPQRLRELGKGIDGRSGFRHFYEMGSSDTKHWRSKNGDANANLSDGIDLEMAKTSLARLMAVKNFEIVNEFDLQDKTPLTVPDPEKDDPLERQWPVKWYSVFEVPAHFTSNNSRHYVGQEQRTSHYETSVWYNLQFVLNGGNGFVGGTTPTDFNYHTPFMGFSAYYSGIDEPLRRFSAINQMYQIRTWSKSTEPGNEGFRIANQGIWEMMGSSNSNQEFHSPSYDIVKQLDNIEAELSDKVLEAMLLQFLDEAEKYNLSTWPRKTDGGNFELDSASKTTADLITIQHNGTPTNQRLSYHYADKFYDIIPRIQNNFDVHCSITNRIIDWCKAAWPLVDFEKYTTNNCSAEVLDCENSEITANKIYKIHTVHDKCIHAVTSNGYNVTQQACSNNDTGKWILEAADTGYFFMKNTASGQYFQTSGTTNGDHVELAVFTGNDSQQWEINELSNCKYNIVSKSANKCLDLKSGNSADGTRFQVWDCVNNSSENREYSFELVGEVEQYQISITKTNDATEGTSDATFRISLDEGITNTTGNAITGTISLTGTATQGDDYTNVTSFSIPNGQNEAVITISVTDDNEAENTETIIATITNPSTGAISNNNLATADIVDNDQYQISITKTSDATEGGADAVFRISLDQGMTNTTGGPITGTITFTGTATTGDDYTAVSSFSITNEKKERRITIRVADDSFVENTETIIATISNPSIGTISNNTNATADIVDNDQYQVSVTKNSDANEGTADATFAVSLDQGAINTTGNAITGTIALSGTATPDDDYTNVNSFSIPNGQNEALITIPIIDDSEVESNETIIATISNPSTGTISNNNTATATITDNDQYQIYIDKTIDGSEGGAIDAIFTVSLDPNVFNTSGSPITGTITYTGTATQDDDYTSTTSFSIDETKNYTSIIIPINDDDKVENIENIIATISNPSIGTIINDTTTLTIQDNDQYQIYITKTSDANEGGNDATFRVSLDQGATNTTGNDITGTIALTGTATQGDDYTTVNSFSIPNGQNQALITIPIVDDNKVEDTETIIATISDPSTGDISNNNVATADIVDNDQYQISITKTSDATEGETDAVFIISLDQGMTNTTGEPITGTITFTGTSTQDDDYTPVSSFSITNGKKERKITIRVINDSEVEDTETIIATINNPSTGDISNNSIAAANIVDNDQYQISITKISDATEGETDATFRVSLDQGITNTTGNPITGTITYSGTATQGNDYTNVSSYSIPNGENQTLITLPIIDDSEVESTEIIIATITNPSTGTISNNNTATATITDNDVAPEYIISITKTLDAIEGERDAFFTVSLGPNVLNTSGSTITGIITLSGTATAGTDYTNKTTFEIPTNTNGLAINIPVLDDTEVEGTETIIATISNPITGTIGNNNTATATITDNDQDPVYNISITKNSDATEGATDATFTVSLDQGITNVSGNSITGTITYAGTATQNDDYSAVSSFSIPNGENKTLITLPIADDTEVEGTETITTTISNPSTGTISNNNTATATITDNDQDPVYSISITKNSDATEGVTDATFTVSLDQGMTNNTGSSITGTITYSGTATQGNDYTNVSSFSIPNGENQTLITLTIADDTEVEGTETIIATISNPSTGTISNNNTATATITDNDQEPEYTISITKTSDAVEGGNDATFTVSLDQGATNTTGNAITGTVSLTGTATQVDDYTNVSSFSIPNGQNEALITITIVDDTEVENIETIIVTISNPSTGTISNNNTATATITDNDQEPEYAISITKTSNANEGGNDATFTVSLDQGATNTTGNAITGTITLSGTATQGNDYTNVSSFSIPNGENQTLITLPIVDDSEVESTETIIATISNPSTGTISNNNKATATITDNDVDPEYNISITKVLDAVEGDSDAFFTVSLDPNIFNTSGSPITGVITLTGTATTGDDYTNITSFEILNGQNYTPITIAINDDTQVEDIETIIATISNPNLGAISNNNIATATITDNDVAPEYNISITKILDATESEVDASFRISLDQGMTNNTGSPITGTITLSGTATQGDDYFTSINNFSIPNGENETLIILSIVDDNEIENTETIIATITDPSIGNISNNNAATAVINDKVIITDVQIYPNPATTTLNIKMPINSINKISEIRIYNFSGKIVKMVKASKDLMVLNLGGLSSGNYIIRTLRNKVVYDEILVIK